jgi:hypothetical protein
MKSLEGITVAPPVQLYAMLLDANLYPIAVTLVMPSTLVDFLEFC